MPATAEAPWHDMQRHCIMTQVWLPHLWNVEHAVAAREIKPEGMHWRAMPIPPFVQHAALIQACEYTSVWNSSDSKGWCSVKHKVLQWLGASSAVSVMEGDGTLLMLHVTTKHQLINRQNTVLLCMKLTPVQVGQQSLQTPGFCGHCPLHSVYDLE